MMSVSNVRPWHLFKFLLEEAILFDIDFPKSMQHGHVCLILVLLDHAVRLTAARDVSNLLLNGSVLSRAVGQKDGADICTLDIGEPCTV